MWPPNKKDEHVEKKKIKQKLAKRTDKRQNKIMRWVRVDSTFLHKLIRGCDNWNP